MKCERYGLVFLDEHIEWFLTFDEAWNNSRGKNDTDRIILETIYPDGHSEINDYIVGL